MDFLKSKPSLGQIILVKEQEENLIFSIGEGKFSVIAKNESFYLHFFIKAEYEIELEKPMFVSGPIIDFHFKIKEDLTLFEKTEIVVPESDNNESNHFYHEIHQGLDNAKLIFKKINQTLFEIEFSGIPSDYFKYYSVIGKCTLPLSDKFERYY